MSSVDRNRAAQALTFLEQGMARGRFKPSGVESCLTCTYQSETSPLQTIFLHGASFGAQLARTLLPAAIHVQGDDLPPLPWCEPCARVVRKMIEMLLRRDSKNRVNRGCAWCGPGGLGTQRGLRPYECAVVGVASGLAGMHLQLCAPCERLYRACPDVSADLAPS